MWAMTYEIVHVEGTGDGLLKTKNEEPTSKILTTVEPPKQESTSEGTKQMTVPYQKANKKKPLQEDSPPSKGDVK